MNYPGWELSFAGGGLLIAMIAIVHVYVSHFAIGGGLFLVLTEMKGHRENSAAILDYVKKHTKFFLLLTMVFGAMTGVGIWFTISLLNPGATSTLIHNFVFAWAIEWVFFLGEIVSLLVYYYTFGRMEKNKHLLVGWIYFIFAWLSLFAINGIICFMLTPGAWLETGNFWDGFFNPSFWPALFYRTFLALMLAGLYGFVTSTRIKDHELRESMVRYCALWLLAPFFFFLASANWYINVLPEHVREVIFVRSPEMVRYIKTFALVSPVIFFGGLVMAIGLPARVKKPLAYLLLLIGLVYMGSFEFIREGGRKPFVIYGHTYSNNVSPLKVEQIRETGILSSAKWVKNKVITDENRLEAGRELFNLTCLPCHSVGGPINDIVPLTAMFKERALEFKIKRLDKSPYMPPFAGTEQEGKALAAYIFQELQGNK
ncbi:MAG: cytochrome ubiquinol oxidase subunit I [Proteobacteria bacterium]|nr:cytochrome ubiquinol oxidase subunit I [Pseudomonadota bacterium]MBU1715336.1 cytochrome ubiquinol oxidase subunit I [Pseudomonadota bacterium]